MTTKDMETMERLKPWMIEAVEKGMTDAGDILCYAVGRCNALCQELLDNKTNRAQVAREKMFQSLCVKFNVTG